MPIQRVPFAIFRERQNLIARQAVARGVRREAAIPEQVQTSAARADPDVAGTIGEQTAHEVAGETVPFRVEPKSPVRVPGQAATHGAQPETAGTVLGQRQNLVALELRGVAVVEHHEAHAVEPRRSFNRSQPQIAVAGTQDRCDTVLRKAVLILPDELLLVAQCLIRAERLPPDVRRCEAAQPEQEQDGSSHTISSRLCLLRLVDCDRSNELLDEGCATDPAFGDVSSVDVAEDVRLEL